VSATIQTVVTEYAISAAHHHVGYIP